MRSRGKPALVHWCLEYAGISLPRIPVPTLPRSKTPSSSLFSALLANATRSAGG